MIISRDQRVVFQPAAYQSMQRGINKIVEAIRPTFGPLPDIVAIDRILDDRMPASCSLVQNRAASIIRMIKDAPGPALVKTR